MEVLGLKNVIVKKVVVLSDRFNKGQRLLKIDCPYCGKEHTHGGGNFSDGEITMFGGHRLSHCESGSKNDGYTLVVSMDVPYEYH